MAPNSDVDLLFLIPWKESGWSESLVESMLYILWDLHLKVGHATRSVRDCIRLGRDDMTIRTALLEYRFLGGHQPLADELSKRLWKDLFKGTGNDFIEAKLAERAARHRKQGGQRYVVEPNVKEGKGGLRDLQTLYWIAKYVNGVRDPADLVREGTFTDDEFRRFERAEGFLLAVRCHLHLITGRAQDQLTFDMQVEVARRMGYEDTSGRRAVEHFMQDYFRHATRVGELTRIFLVALEDRHGRTAPTLPSFLRRRRPKKPFGVLRGRLTVRDTEAFAADNINILRIFDEALRTGMLLHPDAMRLIAANLDRIDDTLRTRPEANRIFLDMMLKHGNPERALRRMNELGVLAAFLPEFAPVVAMMQFNMYHHYTVDEHTIQCISTLAQIERGELTDELPVASRILTAGLVNRRVLYVALLLHDIGKGRAEDHSILGARIARRVCPRLGLKPEECETVEWLVRYHLLMSDMAQKRDLSDPRTVRDFAKAVRSVRRLDLLTVLTVCDIRGVGPGVWNNWKAQLLRSLYRHDRLRARDRAGGHQPRGARNGRQARPARGAVELAQGRVAPRDAAPLRPLLAGPADRRPRRLRAPAAGARRRRHPHRPDPRRGSRRHPRLLRHGRPSRHLLAAGGRAGAGRARTWWTRGPTPPRTASRRRVSGCRTPTVIPTTRSACPACAARSAGRSRARWWRATRWCPRTRSRSASAPSGCPPPSPSTTTGRRSTRSSRSTPATGPACSTT